MKTQIITLESHDDLISVRDRMSWAKTPRILLVIPKFEQVTLRQVDYRILQRHAATLGAQLGLVTRIRKVRAQAETFGIPVFESTGEAQREAWHKPRRRKWTKKAPDKTLREKREQVQTKEEAWRTHPITRVTALAVGVLAVLAIVALFIPRAQVTLSPVLQTQSVTLTANASRAYESVFVTGNLPAREKRVVVEASQTITATGEGTVPQSKSQGEVEFRNLTQQALAVPDGTVVLAGAVRFVTTEAVTVPAGKKILAPVEAAEGGAAGNVEAEAINAIEGTLGLSLAVTNPAALTGGRELASVQANDADRKRVKESLLKELREMALEQLQGELQPNDLLFANTLLLTQTLSEKYDPPPGGVGARLTLTMQVEFAAQYASASDLTELATLAMNAALPSGFRPAAGSVTVTPLSVPVLVEEGTLRWNLRAERTIQQVFDPLVVTQLVQGLGVTEARSNLESALPEAAQPALELAPTWWRWVPLLPFRIDLVTR